MSLSTHCARWIIAATVLVSAGTAHSGELTGSVLNGETLKPMGGVAIRAGKVRATTSAGGTFRIENISGRVTVTANKAGFDAASQTVTIPENGLADVALVLIPKGYGGEQIIIKQDAPIDIDAPSVQTIDREEIATIPGSRGDPLATIRNLPGVSSAQANGPGAGNIVVRGAAPEDSIFVLDGVEIPLVYHFFGLQSILPAEFLESIDFTPGGFGVERGRATGGVVEITTRSQQPDDVGGFAELSFINLAAFVQGPISKKHNLYFTAAVRRSIIDFILPAVIPDDAMVSFTTAPTYYDAQLRVDWTPREHHKFALLGLFSLDNLTLINDGVVPNEPLLTATFETETRFTRLIGSWRYERGSFRNLFTLNGGTTDLEFTLSSDRFLRVDGNRAEIRNDFTWAISKNLQLRAGGDARRARADVRVKLPPPPQEGEGDGNFSSAAVIDTAEDIPNHMASAYAALDISPTSTTSITAGARVDYFHRLGETTWSPRVSASQKLGERVTAKAAVGAYSRPLSQNELLQTNLLPELATQYVLGADVRIAEGIEVSGSGYYTDRRQLVVQDSVLADTDPANALVNRGDGRSFGGEVLLRAKTDRFYGWLSYTLSRSDRIDGPMMDRRLFDFDQTHNIILVGSYKLGTWRFGGRFQYVTGLPDTPVASSTYLADFNIHVPVYGIPNSTRLPAAHQIDLRVDKSWAWDHFKLSAFLDITNVYANPAILGIDYNFNFTERQEIKDIPILPAIGVRGTF